MYILYYLRIKNEAVRTQLYMYVDLLVAKSINISTIPIKIDALERSMPGGSNGIFT